MMKANRRSAPWSVLALAMLAALTASCSERIIPPPTPTPSRRPAPPPPPAPAPPSSQQLPPAQPSGTDWRQAPITPGSWTWAMEGGQSVARFAGGALVVRCDRDRGAIVLQRAGAPTAGSAPLTISATSGVRTFSATPGADGNLTVTLPPRDGVVDAMAFSRGRFAVEAPGLAPLYAPSWPEISRVAEDCR